MKERQVLTKEQIKALIAATDADPGSSSYSLRLDTETNVIIREVPERPGVAGKKIVIPVTGKAKP